MQPRSPAVQRQCQQEPFPPRRLQQHGGQRSAASPAAPARSALSPSEKECDISCFYRLSLSTSQDEPVTLLQIKSHGHERGTTSRKRVCPGGVPGRADTAAAQRGAELRDKNTVVTHGTPAEGSRHEGHGRESAGSAASQHSTAQHGTTQHSTARHNTSRRGTTQHGAAQHGSPHRFGHRSSDANSTTGMHGALRLRGEGVGILPGRDGVAAPPSLARLSPTAAALRL